MIHGYSLVDEPVMLGGCPIATYEDLATMKIFAIGGRSEKKDFIDLHEMLLAGSFSLDELFRVFRKKFSRHRLRGKMAHFRRSLTDFALADRSSMPKMLKTQRRSWPLIKRHMVAWVSEMAEP